MARSAPNRVSEICNQTLQQIEIMGWLKLKRGYWVIEGWLHHALDVSLAAELRQVHILQRQWSQPLTFTIEFQRRLDSYRGIT